MLVRVVAVVALVARLSDSLRTSTRSGVHAYEAFRRKFGSHREESEASYHARVALFEKRRAEVSRHNAQPGITWVAAVNQFADYTDEEFKAMLGHRPAKRFGLGMPTFGALLETQPSAPLAESIDYRQQLNTSKGAKDQGGCGSCWAVATAGALETHGELVAHDMPEISYEELVDCTPNPEECGGKGGCGGATSELAFEYVHKNGLALKKDYKGYQSGGNGKCAPPSNKVLSTQGFVRLPENQGQPLMEALATKGPVVVSADATYWSSYHSGVFTGCKEDAIINHAILAMGYGHDEGLKMDYWLIRNSWGASWGEGGFIRVQRHKGDKDYCGIDHQPLEGVGCKGGPESLPVCGMCGILSDSAYPTGVSVKKL